MGGGARGNFGRTKGTSKRETLLLLVSNQKLKNAINEMYRPNAQIGDGGLSDAIRYELKNRTFVGGKSHLRKGKERLKNLENILRRQQLNDVDQTIIKELIKDLKKALEGK